MYEIGVFVKNIMSALLPFKYPITLEKLSLDGID